MGQARHPRRLVEAAGHPENRMTMGFRRPLVATAFALDTDPSLGMDRPSFELMHRGVSRLCCYSWTKINEQLCALLHERIQRAGASYRSLFGCGLPAPAPWLRHCAPPVVDENQGFP